MRRYDWWITSDKGCLSDGFTVFYNYIYVFILFLLVIITMYSTFNSTSFYSIDTFKPLFFMIFVLFIYHLIYFIVNFSYRGLMENRFFSKIFISRILKGRKGYWTKNDSCNTVYGTTFNRAEGDEAIEESEIEKEYKTIWDKRSSTSKFKIIINMIILATIIGYIVNYTGNKYIQNIVKSMESLEGKTKNIYIILITLLISFSIIQFVYLIYSTVMIDECVINRITDIIHKIDEPTHQKYCKGKIGGETAVECENLKSKEDV